MKPIFYVYAFALLFIISCDSNKKQETEQTQEQQKTEQTQEQQETNANLNDMSKCKFPWDFPANIKSSELTAGQAVLSIQNYYEDYIGEKPAENNYIFQNAILSSIGNDYSHIKDPDGYTNYEYIIPNSLIIPIPEGQTAKKGDIVLTWSSYYGQMQRAIVINDENPSSPTVHFLDMVSDDKNIEETLTPNTFVVLNDTEWQPGIQIIDENKNLYKIINVSNDKILAIDAILANITVLDKNKCEIVPFDQNLEVGDEILTNYWGSLQSSTIKKIDKEIGTIEASDSYGSVKTYSILEVLKK